MPEFALEGCSHSKIRTVVSFWAIHGIGLALKGAVKALATFYPVIRTFPRAIGTRGTFHWFINIIQGTVMTFWTNMFVKIYSRETQRRVFEITIY